jgi:hypothetical protein
MTTDRAYLGHRVDGIVVVSVVEITHFVCLLHKSPTLHVTRWRCELRPAGCIVFDHYVIHVAGL